VLKEAFMIWVAVDRTPLANFADIGQIKKELKPSKSFWRKLATRAYAFWAEQDNISLGIRTTDFLNSLVFTSNL